MEKYINYIKFSGGGMTVTGGEPLLQADFVTEVFKMAKKWIFILPLILAVLQIQMM